MLGPQPPPGSESDARWRLFIALPLPATVLGVLHAQLEPYRRAFPGARWLDPETWHVTLLFLGHVPARHAPALAGACADVAAGWPAFGIDVARGGGRARRGEGVAWLRVGTGARGVIALAEDLDRVIRRVDASGPQPRRAPSAHVTVARRADVALTSALGDEALGALGAGWRVDRVDLMRSHLGRSGARYEVVAEALLGAPIT